MRSLLQVSHFANILKPRFANCEHHNARHIHVISKKRLTQAIARDQALSAPLIVWYKVARTATWASIADVRRTYPTADFVEPYTVFHIKGNRYRLITKIEYRWELVFIKAVLTHAEYDKGDWKK